MTKLENPPFQGSISHRKNGWIFDKKNERFLWIAPVKSHGWIQGDFQFPVGWKTQLTAVLFLLVVEPTPLTNGFIFPKVRAEIKNDWNHHLEIIEMLAKNNPVLLVFFKQKNKKNASSST